MNHKQMDTVLFKITIAAIFCSLFACNASSNLFRENTTNWDQYGDARWSFSKKELAGNVADESGYIMTRQTYRDFLLELEFMPDSTINSGVFVRCKNKEINANDCHELNIWDLHPNQDNRTGAIVLKKKPLVKVETIGKWNVYRIKAEKSHVEVWVNNVLTAEGEFENILEGYIGLQAMGTGEIRFRNIRITPLTID